MIMRYDSTLKMTEQQRIDEYSRLLAKIPNEPAGNRVQFVMRACFAKEQTVRIWNCYRAIPQSKLYMLGCKMKKLGFIVNDLGRN